MRERTKTFSVRMSEKEYGNLNKIIEKIGTTKSAFIRSVANRYLPKERLPDEYYKFINRLTEIGNELYQIASETENENLNEQVKKLDELILEINKFYTMPERMDAKWLQQKSGT